MVWFDRIARWGVHLMWLGLIVALPAQAVMLPAERAVLVDIYSKTNGAKWINKSNWLIGDPCENKWYGISCDNSNTRVIDIILYNNNLNGMLPPIGRLSSIKTIALFQNNLTGSIPSLSELSSLVWFNVGQNRLSGSIPSLSGLRDLSYFGVYQNNIIGNIPDLSQLTTLTQFQADGNLLTGSIPSLAGLGSLEYFNVANNKLVGPVPSLSGLSRLTGVALAGNMLSGQLPQFPVPNSILANASTLCPNNFTPSNDTPSDKAWDAATGVSPWSRDCGPVATAGQCGASNGVMTTSAPLANLCKTGTASAATGTGPWNWTCTGSSGTPASCSANQAVPKPAPMEGLPMEWSQMGFGSSVRKLVLVTHGWNSEASAWPNSYVQKICQKNGTSSKTNIFNFEEDTRTGVAVWCKKDDLLVASFNWKQDSHTGFRLPGSAMSALSNAQGLAAVFSWGFERAGIRPIFLHLVGHSAGAGFVEEFGRPFKAYGSVVHSTFLDAFCPDPFACTYGASSSWAEQYYHDASLQAAGVIAASGVMPIVGGAAVGVTMLANALTGVTLENAYNFNLTGTEDIDLPWTSHAYPYRSYLASAGIGYSPGGGANLQRIGAHFAAEFDAAGRWTDSGISLNRDYGKGKLCALDNNKLTSLGRAAVAGECTSTGISPLTQTRQQTITVGNSTSNCLSLGSSVSNSTPRVSANMAYANTCGLVRDTPRAVRSFAREQRQAAATYATGTTVAQINLSGPVNKLNFDYQFLSGPVGENTYFQVYIDGMLMFVRSNATTGMGAQNVRDLGIPELAAGPHELQIVLVSGTSEEAEVLLSDLTYELKAPVPASQPTFDPTSITLSAVASQWTNLSVTARGGGTMRYALADGSSLPPGVMLDALTGQIVGTPTAAGAFNGAVIATNEVGSATVPYQLVVTDAVNVTPVPTLSQWVLMLLGVMLMASAARARYRPLSERRGARP